MLAQIALDSSQLWQVIVGLVVGLATLCGILIKFIFNGTLKRLDGAIGKIESLFKKYAEHETRIVRVETKVDHLSGVINMRKRGT